MVNLVKIKRNVEGLPVALHITGHEQFGRPIADDVAFHSATLGELAGGGATISYLTAVGERVIPFTLDTHADDNGTAGKVAYDALKALTTHTTHEHGATPTLTLTQDQKDLNNVKNSVVGLINKIDELTAESIPHGDGTLADTLTTLLGVLKTTTRPVFHNFKVYKSDTGEFILYGYTQDSNTTCRISLKGMRFMCLHTDNTDVDNPTHEIEFQFDGGHSTTIPCQRRNFNEIGDVISGVLPAEPLVNSLSE